MKTRSNEKTYPDVGGGFVEPHPRGDGIDWSEVYPHKGTETIEARGLVGAGELERAEAARAQLVWQRRLATASVTTIDGRRVVILWKGIPTGGEP